MTKSYYLVKGEERSVISTEEKVHKTQLLHTVINTCLLTNDKKCTCNYKLIQNGYERQRDGLYCSLHIREAGAQIKLQKTLGSCFQTCFISAARTTTVYFHRITAQ